MQGIPVKNDHNTISRLKKLRLLLLLGLIPMLASCSMMIGSASNRLAGNLADALADHDDAATVQAAAPAYLLMMDALVRGNPEDPRLLTRASGLYGAYAGAFVSDPTRSRKLTARALDYAMRAVCSKRPRDCSLRTAPFDQFQNRVAAMTPKEVPAYYALGAAWAGWIQARKDDFSAVAELSRVELIMGRVIELDETHMQGAPHLYMGVLSILLPPALGGKPDAARYHFERAIELSEGRNLMIKVMYARTYARMLFNRPLHDRLLHEVLSAQVRQPGYVLLNTMAQQQARQLLETASEYF